MEKGNEGPWGHAITITRSVVARRRLPFASTDKETRVSGAWDSVSLLNRAVLFLTECWSGLFNYTKPMFNFSSAHRLTKCLRSRGFCDSEFDQKLNKLIDLKLAARETVAHSPHLKPQSYHPTGHVGIGSGHSAQGSLPLEHPKLPPPSVFKRITHFVRKRPFFFLSAGLGIAVYSYCKLYPDHTNKLMGLHKGCVRENLIIRSESADLQSYKYSISKAVDGDSAATQAYGKMSSFSWDQTLFSDLDLSEEQLRSLNTLCKEYDKKNREVAGQLTTTIRSVELIKAVELGKVKKKEQAEKLKENKSIDDMDASAYKVSSRVDSLLHSKVKLDMELITAVSAILTSEQHRKWTKRLEEGRDSLLPWTDMLAERPVAFPQPDRPKVFVLTFKGDMRASQVKQFRREVTAVIEGADAERGDQVVILLNSSGGTVQGYGLAAAQLQRIKARGIELTVCVDEVAASGGYLMACVADKIVASPFAIVGSIGVVATMPNFYERLKREGIEVEDVTAGQYKRTLTPYKKMTAPDKAKMKRDLEDIHEQFKSFIAQYRPKLDMREVGTGEVWLGSLALKKGLCDELRTSDDYLLDCLARGSEVYRVRYGVRATGLKGMLHELQEEHQDEASASSLVLGLIGAMHAVASALTVLGSSSASVPSTDRDLITFEPQLYGGPLDQTRFKR